jgi:hypothetical protein
LGVVLAEAEKPVEAEAAFQEVLRIRRALAAKAPSMYVRTLVPTLNNLGVFCQRSDRLAEAIEFYREVWKHRDVLANHESTIVQAHFIQALSNFALLLKITEVSDEVVAEVRTQLVALGVTQLPESEEWIEEELDNLYF